MAPKKKELKKNEEETVEGIVITRIGRGMYQCPSRSQDNVLHTIDIMANDGLGECDCHDFMYRRWPRWQRTGKLYDSFRCFHIRHVRQHVLDQIIQHYIKLEKGI
jgi:predicted secreted protein